VVCSGAEAGVAADPSDGDVAPSALIGDGCAATDRPYRS
jgi:biotin synthase-related radical SAM superfamily protein